MIKIKKIGLLFIALAQLFLLAHSIIPHHHHAVHEICCHHENDFENIFSLLDTDHEPDEHITCSILNDIFAQVHLDLLFVFYGNLNLPDTIISERCEIIDVDTFYHLFHYFTRNHRGPPSLS